MKKEDLFESLNDVKDEYVSEAGKTAPAKKQSHWLRWGAAAACVAVAVFAGTRIGGPAAVTPTPPSVESGEVAVSAQPVESVKPTTPAAESPKPTQTAPVVEPSAPPATVNGLPVLTVADFSGGMGFEGLLAYDPDELADSCPWKGETLETMPVYKNQAPGDTAGFVEGDRDAMEAQVREIAARLGVTGELTITDDATTPEEIAKGATPQGPYYVRGTAEGVEITAYADQSIQVEFDPAVTLPEGLRFDESDADALREVGEYLKEEYAELLDMAEPVVTLQGGDYSFRGDRSGLDLYLYDGAGDLPEQIAGHDLKSAHLCEDENKLYLIWLDAYDLSEKVGDYPILTAEEATDLLCQGNYITTVPAEMPGREKIVRTELMYRTERTAEYFMPYYRFLVEVDDPAATNDGAVALGLKTYGAYYVPAVRGEYLTGMPVWNGDFNI